MLLLLVMVCTPLIVFTLHTASQDRRAAKERWGGRAKEIAQTLNVEEEKTIEGVKTLLRALADSEPVLVGNSNGFYQAAARFLRPPLANLGLTKPNGELIASIGRGLVGPDHANEAYFIRARESEAFARGDLTTSHSGPRGLLYYGLPVLNGSRELVAVVFATLDLKRRTNQCELPFSASVTQLARDGTVLAYFIQTNATSASRTGERISDTNLLNKYGSGEEAYMKVDPDSMLRAGEQITDTNLLTQVFGGIGVFEGPDPDGDNVVYAYAPTRSTLLSSPTAVVLAIPGNILFADADRLLARNLKWLGAAMLLALLAGWIGSSLLILRPVRVLVETSSRVAAGDLSARTGLNYPRDELGQLARAFDVMASTLEKRELERRRDNKKLQVLSQRLVEVQEGERRQIARELHDEVGQSLTAAEINLQTALGGANPPSTQSRLRASSEMIRHVLEQVQDLSLNLRPSMLDDLGLESALRWYTGRQAETSGIEAEFVSDPLEQRLDPMIETECFRVAQEALTNVLRHSKASSVTVELRADDGTLRLTVRDDGVGFDVAAVRDQAVRGRSLGVLSMEERVSLAGGKLELISVAGEGTEVRASFPLKWREQN